MQIKVKKIRKRIKSGSLIQITWVSDGNKQFFEEGSPSKFLSLDRNYRLVNDNQLIVEWDDNGSRNNGWYSVYYDPYTGICRYQGS